jgi:hypothetical protein
MFRRVVKIRYCKDCGHIILGMTEICPHCQFQRDLLARTPPAVSPLAAATNAPAATPVDESRLPTASNQARGSMAP